MGIGDKMRKQKWFIEEIEPWDMSFSSACLHLTNYKLSTHQDIEEVLGKKVSKLRWAVLEDAKIDAGSASGRIVIGRRTFKLTYAWGGINSDENWHKRESYTVQIGGRYCEKYLTDLVTQINEDERWGRKCVGSIFFPFLNAIKPYRLINNVPSYIPDKQKAKYVLLKKEKRKNERHN